MRPVSRREALLLGGVGTAALVAGGTGLLLDDASLRGASSPFDASSAALRGGAALLEPTMLSSAAGLLQLTLTAAAGAAMIGGRRAEVWRYNDSLPGPTLSLRPGDRLRVRLHNRLPEPTNLHVHGLHVSPLGNSDNVFVRIDPGSSFDYDFQLPPDHPPGVFWYHPHHHGMVARQVFHGLYGAIIVNDPEPIPDVRERVLVISDLTLNRAGAVPRVSSMQRMMGREGAAVLVNGQPMPHLGVSAGRRERWRIVNACAARYLRLRLDGHQLQLLGIDSGRFPAPQPVREVVLVPGNRADLLVTPVVGTGTLTALPVDRGSMMGETPSQATVPLASLTATPSPATPVDPIPAAPPRRDLRNATVTAHRTLTFAMGMGGAGGMGAGGMGAGPGAGMMAFTINGRTFDPSRVDTHVQVGTVEEWTLVNASPMDHPVHLHVWPMQIVEQHGSPVDEVIWQDVVNVPARGQTRVRILFNDFPGTTVYHCHILDHEDAGMMAALQAR